MKTTVSLYMHRRIIKTRQPSMYHSFSARTTRGSYSATGKSHGHTRLNDDEKCAKKSDIERASGSIESWEQGDGDKAERVEFGRFLAEIGRQKVLIAVAMVCQAISGSAMVAYPFAIGKIVDEVNGVGGDGDSGALKNICIGMGVLFTLSSITTGARVGCLSLAGARIQVSLRKRLFAQILAQETRFFDERPTGELISRLTTDVAAISKSMTQNISQLLRSGIVATGAASMLVYLSPRLSMVSLGAFPPMFALAGIFGRYSRNLSRELADANALATELASERISSVRTVRVFGGEHLEVQRYGSLVDETYAIARSIARVDGAYSAALLYAAQISLLAVLWLGGKRVASERHPITVGTLASFSIYSIQLAAAVSLMGNAYGQLCRALGSSHRIFHILHKSPMDTSSTINSFGRKKAAKKVGSKALFTPLSSLTNSIVTFENVQFSYRYPASPRARYVLKDISFSAEQGEITAIAGASGAGKSTIANLLTRLYVPNAGTVRIGGVDLSCISSSALRKNIVSVVPQEPSLISGTIAENIRYGHPHITDGLITAANDGASYEMIMDLPLAFQYEVGARGENLSGGQRARIALCRSLYRSPRVLILDEHSVALDAQTERAVSAAVFKYARNRGAAVIIIAHRISSLQTADKIVLLKDGKIAEEGRFDELICKPDGELRKLFAVPS